MSIRTTCIRASAALASLSMATAAMAGIPVPPNNVPEPGTWALVGLAIAVGALVSRNRRK